MKRDTVWSGVADLLNKKIWKKNSMLAAKGFAAAAGMIVLWQMIVPGISMTGKHPTLQAEELTAWSGDVLRAEVHAEADAGLKERVFVLTAEGMGADLAPSYHFNEDGIAEIADEAGKTILLHRTIRGDQENTVDYWFTLEEGEETRFFLDLADEVVEGRTASAAAAVRMAAGEDDTATASDAEREETATASNAVREETEKRIRRASASNAVRTASASNAAVVTEERDDGFKEILDGEIFNDLAPEEEEEETSEITAFVKISAGAGKNYEAAVRDAARNADKRGNSQLKFQWKSLTERAVVTPEMLWSGDGVQIAVIFDGDARLPEGANLSVEEISPDSEEYRSYVEQTKNASGSQEKEVSFARFFDITILDADGMEVEPAAPVKVVITYDEVIRVREEDDLNVVHFKEETPEILAAETAGTGEAAQAAAETAGAVQAAEVDAVTFTAESFSVYGVVCMETIETTVIAADGETYRITVTYGPEAGIPAGARLSAREMLEGDEEYQPLAVETAVAVGSTVANLSHLRMFDIQILSAEGEKLEPAAPVQVMIGYAEAARIEAGRPLQVVHLGEEMTEIIAPENSMSGEGSVDEIRFEANSFSVYSVVSIGSAENAGGHSYAVINPAVGSALQNTALNKNKLKAIAVTVHNNRYLRSGEDVTIWTFTEVGNGSYYITDPSGNYLNITGKTNSDGAVKVSSKPQALKLTQGTGDYEGMVRITNEHGLAINNYSCSVSGGFGPYNDRSKNEWFRLYEAGAVVLYPAYAAEKISAQDIEDGQRVMIYRSVYNEASGSYEDRVIDGRGNAVMAYDKGDQVSLRSEEAPVWAVIMHRDAVTQELNGYYDFYNEETGLYLSPCSDGSLVAEEGPGVTLNGRRDGGYNSTIEAWDRSAWAWYGYRITADEEGSAVLESGTGTDSQEFSFAAYSSDTTEELHAVDTVDSAAQGVRIRMFNYPDRKSISDVTGSDSYAVRVLPAQHVGARLENGYPVFKNGKNSGSALFDPGSKYYQGEGNHLFLESGYHSTGYYEYNAFNNFAQYDKKSGKFTVYQEIGTPSNDNQFYYKRGNFFPFSALNIKNKATNKNLYNGSGSYLDPVDPADQGTLYMISDPDHYFGMSVEATFMQPKNGHEKGDPVVYEFNGDDDLWIFIDDVLLLDIGGVHDAWPGSINFATGEIDGRGAGGADTIRECFKNAGVFPDGTAWADAEADRYFNGDTFVDYGSHSFRMFYMEHGASASNLEMRFNLPVIEKGKFSVAKELDGTSQAKFSNVSFAYQAFRKDGGADVPLTEAVYDGTNTPVIFYDSVEINGKNYTNVFYLKPGETATFAEMAEDTEYYVQELGVGADYYDRIIVNDVQIDGQAVTATDGIYPTSPATVGSRAKVTYTNHCSEKNLNELQITKKLSEGSADTGDTFEFRVLLENAKGELAPYSTGEYCIRNEAGEYFHYVDGKLTSNGMTPIAASVAGNNGTIAGIPAGYTVVIRNLLAGTEFYVEEIRNPAGWVLETKEVTEGFCGASELGGTGFAGDAVTADGQILLDTDAKVIFTNRAEQLLKVEKKWGSGNFVSQHGEIQVALFKVEEDDRLTLVEGTVRTITADSPETEYHVPELTGYAVRELAAQDGAADAVSVTPLKEGESIAVSGETNAIGTGMTDTYLVSYNEETGKTVITNTMPTLTVNKQDISSHQLAGAVFRLLQEDRTAVVTGYESIVSTDAASGNLLDQIRLADGSYYLEETKAPDGYIRLERKIKITVDGGKITAVFDDGTPIADENAEAADNVTITVQNNPGYELPATGGPGTALFHISGAVLVILAIILLIRRKPLIK